MHFPEGARVEVEENFRSPLCRNVYYLTNGIRGSWPQDASASSKLPWSSGCNVAIEAHCAIGFVTLREEE